MRILGVSGHQSIPEDAREYVERQLQAVVAEFFAHGPVVGVSSLAAGADQMFSRVILEMRGELRAIIPSTGYENTFEAEPLAEYQRLIGCARQVEVLDYDRPTEEAFYAAGKRMVEMSDSVIAVWDGLPARGLGGTADVVAFAHGQNRPVIVIWPLGVQR